MSRTWLSCGKWVLEDTHRIREVDSVLTKIRSRLPLIPLESHGINVCTNVQPVNAPVVTIPDETADEERFVTVGSDILGRILVVVYTVLLSLTLAFSCGARSASKLKRRGYLVNG